jgi:hypothetical protein
MRAARSAGNRKAVGADRCRLAFSSTQAYKGLKENRREVGRTKRKDAGTGSLDETRLRRTYVYREEIEKSAGAQNPLHFLHGEPILSTILNLGSTLPDT